MYIYGIRGLLYGHMFTFCFSSRLKSEQECTGSQATQVRELMQQLRQFILSQTKDMTRSLIGDSLNDKKCISIEVH